MAATRKPKAKRKAAPRKPSKPKTLAPETTPADPEGGSILCIPQRTAGVRVDEFSVLTLGAYWACIRYISESMAVMPWHVFERLANGGRERRPDNTADWLLSVQANPETPAFHFKETIVAHALSWGNGYAEIERDMAGRPVWLWQLTPDRVRPARTDSGRLVYDVINPGEPNTVLEASDVFHLRGLGFDGLVGYSVARMAARAIGAGIALEEAVGGFFANDSTPGGILKTPNRLDEVAQKNLAASWAKRHSGPANKRMIAILEQGLEFQQMSETNEQAQLIENRQMTPAEICRWFRVPPHKIGDLAKATFSNIESQAIEAVTDCLMPWGCRLEAEANIKLFGRTNRGTLFTKLNFMALLRGDSKARSEFYQTMLDRGILDINEVRALEEMNPIGSDGDKRFVQSNMTLLEKAGEEPPPGAAPIAGEPAPSEPEADTTEGEADDEPAKMRAALRPVFEDACGRIIGREVACVFDAAKKPDEFPQWLEKFGTEQFLFAKKTLAPSLSVVAVSQSVSDAFLRDYRSELTKRCDMVKAGTFSRDTYGMLGKIYADSLLKLMENETNATRSA